MAADPGTDGIISAEAQEPLGWNLYGVSADRPFAYVAAGDTTHPYYGFVAGMDRTPRPRNPRWHVVVRKLRKAAGT